MKETNESVQRLLRARGCSVDELQGRMLCWGQSSHCKQPAASCIAAGGRACLSPWLVGEQVEELESSAGMSQAGTWRWPMVHSSLAGGGWH